MSKTTDCFGDISSVFTSLMGPRIGSWVFMAETRNCIDMASQCQSAGFVYCWPVWLVMVWLRHGSSQLSGVRNKSIFKCQMCRG